MGLLDELMGGGRQRNDFEDFVNRYEQGPPWAGISDQEPVRRHH